MKPDGVFHCRFSGRNHETIYKAITYAAALLTAVMMLTALVTGSPAEAGSQPAELWPASGGDSLSGYGYVAADSAGIESNPGIPAENRVGTVYRYMLCRVTGTVSVNGIIWYEIGYSGQTGYINADDMIMLTDDELKAFIDSPDYWEGLRNNADGLVLSTPAPAAGYFYDSSRRVIASMSDVLDEDGACTAKPTASPAPTMEITLPAGMTVEETASELVRIGVLEDGEKFLQLCREGSAFRGYEMIDDIMRLQTASYRKYMLEGYLAPGTRPIEIDADEETIIRSLLAGTLDVYDGNWLQERAAASGMTMDQVLTLASMIELESEETDFARVSAVYYNRVHIGMKLQSDATIRFITGIPRMALTAEDIATESPYNTYLYTGLPAGPICNPSPEAVIAALYPDERFLAEGYLFFCPKTPESGELVFAKTLTEHEENVRVYRPYWEAYDRSRGIEE